MQYERGVTKFLLVHDHETGRISGWLWNGDTKGIEEGEVAGEAPVTFPDDALGRGHEDRFSMLMRMDDTTIETLEAVFNLGYQAAAGRRPKLQRPKPPERA